MQTYKGVYPGVRPDSMYTLIHHRRSPPDYPKRDRQFDAEPTPSKTNF